PGAARATPLLPYLALLRVGFAEPARSPAPLVSSYLTVSPLPPRHPFGHRRDGGLFSVALVRGVTPPGRYPAPCPAEPGLSSRRVATAGDRPAFSGAPDSIAEGSQRLPSLSRAAASPSSFHASGTHELQRGERASVMERAQDDGAGPSPLGEPHALRVRDGDVCSAVGDQHAAPQAGHRGQRREPVEGGAG